MPLSSPGHCLGEAEIEPPYTNRIKEDDPMSLINKEVADFSVQAYHHGKFHTVSVAAQNPYVIPARIAHVTKIKKLCIRQLQRIQFPDAFLCAVL